MVAGMGGRCTWCGSWASDLTWVGSGDADAVWACGFASDGLSDVGLCMAATWLASQCQSDGRKGRVAWALVREVGRGGRSYILRKSQEKLVRWQQVAYPKE